jgi:hypothetical protein
MQAAGNMFCSSYVFKRRPVLFFIEILKSGRCFTHLLTLVVYTT